MRPGSLIFALAAMLTLSLTTVARAQSAGPSPARETVQANPDDPEGWVRLVRAYAVLGDAGKRDAALASARTRYAGKTQVLQQLEAAAKAEPMQ